MLARLGWVIYWAFAGAAGLTAVGTAIGVGVNLYPTFVSSTAPQFDPTKPFTVQPTDPKQSEPSAFQSSPPSYLGVTRGAVGQSNGQATNEVSYAAMAGYIAVIGFAISGLLFGMGWAC
jgi:hypothetical protein